MKKALYVLLIIFIIFPMYVNAATSLTASNQNPSVGSNFYVQLALNYGEKVRFRDIHLIMTYDKTAFELVGLYWNQEGGTYQNNKNIGEIYIEKNANSEAWKSGQIFIAEFKSIAAKTSSIGLKKNVESHYTDGNEIAQTMSGVTINAVEPDKNTYVASLGVENYIILPTFNRKQEKYRVEVPADVTGVNITAKKVNDKQRITGTGHKVLNYGLNKAFVTVIAESGDRRVYEIDITRKDNRTGDTSLKSLTVTNTKIQIEKNQYTYNAVVSKSIDNVLITALTTDPNATLTGTGTKHLEIGQNTFVLSVDSLNGKNSKYTINVTRSNEELTDDVASNELQSLKINDLLIDLNNEKKIYLYGVNQQETELSISAIPKSTMAKVSIAGNEKLIPGINVIDITVTENGFEDNIYKVIAYKDQYNARVIKDYNDILKMDANYIYKVNTTASHIIPERIIYELKQSGKLFYFKEVNMYNGIIYEAMLNDRVDYGELDASFKKISDNPLTYTTKIPSQQEITLYVGEVYNNDTMLKIYSYKEEKQYQKVTDGVQVVNGYITFTTDGNSNYIFTTNTLIDESSAFEKLYKKYKNYFIGGAIALIAILFITSNMSKKTNKTENKEASY